MLRRNIYNKHDNSLFNRKLMSHQQPCFHCGETVPDELALFVIIDKKSEPMCCYGCQAIAEQIIELGLTDYYRHRTHLPAKPDELIPDQIKELNIFDNEKIQSNFLTADNEDAKEGRFIIEGIVCPACSWLIESSIGKLDGINKINVNYSTQRCTIRWDEKRIKLSDILLTIRKLGYKAIPFDPRNREIIYEKERQSYLIRLGIAGLFGMQVMMISFALYFGEANGIEHRYRIFFQWLSLILTLPSLLYSASPIFKGALRDIMVKRPGMDIPICLGISIAFITSLHHTVVQEGHVYFDSIVMFVFFILAGRYFEFISRKKSIAQLDNISSLLPLYANKIDTFGKIETVLTNELKQSDKVIVKPGEVIPVDGSVYQGQSTVNESIVTGESLPIIKTSGMHVLGGSTNVESPLYINNLDTGEKTFLNNISRLIESASQKKSSKLRFSEKISSLFIVFILCLATLTAFYWYQYAPDKCLEITIAVLVVSCPCALSLAIPTAVSSLLSTLLRQGVALLNPDIVEKFKTIDTIVFDKTGTLTEGNLVLESFDVHDAHYDKESLLMIACALEQGSEHPIATAIKNYGDHNETALASNIKNFPGKGITGKVDNDVWFLGTEEFINENTQNAVNTPFNNKTGTTIFLANHSSLTASLHFTDRIRESSKALITGLQKNKYQIVMLSGDQKQVVKKVADELNIVNHQSGLKPEDKVHHIQELQDAGYKVCIIGDGVNDAPAFAQADMAIAMNKASDIAKLNADTLLMKNDINIINDLFTILKRTDKTIRHNFIWVVVYNLIALPVAIAGLLAPWMAALGMSLSSLIVVINSGRLNKVN